WFESASAPSSLCFEGIPIGATKRVQVIFVFFFPTKQKAMELAISISVDSRDVAATIDSEGESLGCAGDINRGELTSNHASTQQKAVGVRASRRTRCAIAVKANNVSPRADSTIVQADSDGEINRSEFALS